MSYTTILTDLSEGVLTITFNRPEVLNAFDAQMSEEVLAALDEAESDPAVHCVVITGTGRGFSAGQDLRVHLADGTAAAADKLHAFYNPIIMKMRSLEKPIIAAVNGVAAGAGMSLALAADLRIASDQARFIETFDRIGLVPDAGASILLPWIVGAGKAAELFLLADEVSAEEALRLELVNKVVPAAKLAEAAATWAHKLAEGPGLAQGLTKRVLNHALLSQLADVLEYETLVQGTAARSADHQEAVAAFVEKRSPVFRGR
jgi:2-(1,2-epoxy-1,2-dihydrophenyl)acetyl-CoA isomerase